MLAPTKMAQTCAITRHVTSCD